MELIKKVLFIKNAFILTATSLLLRAVGIFYKVWMADKIGAEGVGLYHLVFSVYVLASTFATSGICTATTRLVTDYLAGDNPKGAVYILKRSILITTVVAVFSIAAVFFGADFIAKILLGEAEAALAIKILTISLPFMGISSCVRGYFLARRKALQPSLAQIFEQITRISAVLLIISKFYNRGIGFMCAAVIFGDVSAEIVSCVLLYIMYKTDCKRSLKSSEIFNMPKRTVKKILRIAAPITSGRYLNSLLRTTENILVPKALQKSSLSASAALSAFGNIKGMALPILLFPSSLLNSISILLIPEMSEASTKKQGSAISRISDKLITVTATFGFYIGAVFFCLGNELGQIIYKESEVGALICALAPLVPVMYIDSVADGMLKGLDQQLICFRNCILDSSLRIILIMLIVPFYSIKGFIAVMYFSNFLTATLNIARLLKISKTKIKPLKWIVKPLLFSAVSVIMPVGIFKNFGSGNIYVYTFSVLVTSCSLYAVFMGFIKAVLKPNKIKRIAPQ